MNKNLEDLKRRIEIRDKVGYINEESIVEILYDFIPILEDFEKRLNKLEKEEEGFRPKIRIIESPELIKSGHSIKPKTQKPKPKPRPKVIYNYKIGGIDPD